MQAMQAAATGGAVFTPAPSIMAPSGLSPISTIAPVEAKREIPQHRPILAPPKRNIMVDLLACHQKTEELNAKNAKVFEAETTTLSQELDQLSLEKQEALQKEVEAARSRSTWQTLAIVSQYIAGVGAITASVACGGWPSIVLGLSGGIGIGTRIIQDTNLANVFERALAWAVKSEELQKKITNNIEVGAFLLQMGLGLAGGVGAWQAGVAAAQAANVQNVIGKATSFVTTASTVMGSGTKVGMAVYDKRIAEFRARSKELNSDITVGSQEMTEQSKQMVQMVELSASEVDEIRKAIQNSQISID